MRLDFNVLWVDDQPDRVASQIEAIGSRTEEQGFQFNVRGCISVAQVRGAIGDDVYKDEVDLVLVDWDLGADLRGEAVIEEIREVVSYKDIVFYSALKSTQELRTYAFQKELEGVYCATREHLVEEVMGVFESLVKKVLDLDHTRGIVMGATSDIDHMVNQCLVAVHALADENGRRVLLGHGREFVEAEIKKLTELATKLSAANSLEDFFEAHAVFTANDRLRVLARALEDASLAGHKEYRKSVTRYQQDVVPKRNVLGHAIRQSRDGVYVLVDNKGNEFNVETTRDLRRVILLLRTEFRKLLGALQS